MPANTAPIGIFDSGVGGLTVAHAIAQHLPNESLLYFGDTAHMPYGEKSREAIVRYSLRITDFLLAHACKIVVIACNTASAAAYNAVQTHIAGRVPLIDVINPVVEAVCQSDIKRVGLIATSRTVKSGMYAEKLHQMQPGLELFSKATHSLASVIEEGLHNNDKLMDALIEHYFSDIAFQHIEGLILGCTHYPLIKPAISRYFQQRTPSAVPIIFDSTDNVARCVQQRLADQYLLNPNKQRVQHRFCASDYTKSFEQTAAYFFGKPIHLEQCDIWGK